MFNVLFKNLALKIFSLILAILFWIIIIASQQTPFQFADQLEIKPFNLSEQLSLVTSLPKVKIKILASKEILPKLTKQDFEAYIDLKNIQKGKNILSVAVAPKIPNVTVASINPSQVTVEIENVSQKQVPISAFYKGSPSEGYKIGELIPQTAKAQIKGAESVIKKISDVKGIIYLDGAESENFQKDIVLQAFDNNGAEIKEVSIEPRNVKVDITVLALMSEKSVDIKVITKGSLKNASVLSVKTDPATIEIKGDKKSLEGIEYIETIPMDITDAVETVEKYAALNLPKGLSLVDESKNKIKVTIEIKPY
ncbi:hypothetical protein HZA39_00405 [Candidatus Peregrinibacteria bacterium]|nr:hypothetical protein [Candidatus Peregrinibacteria bacterium]